MGQRERCDVLVVGAGFTGIYAVYKMRELGFSVIGVERGAGVGGTWYWNRYPGLRCDVESLDYSYSFRDDLQQEWTWTEKFPAQPDILSYLEWVATKIDVTQEFRFNTEVTGATWNEETSTWLVETAGEASFEANFVIWGTGILSVPKIPEIPGLDDFTGEVLVTATWPFEPVSFKGKRVAVLGTGSSGIQVIPIVAEEAEHLYVLQRTPSFSLPARNAPLTPERIADVKSRYTDFRREARVSMLGCVTDSANVNFGDLTPEQAEEELWKTYNYGSPLRFASTFNDILVDVDSNNFAAEFAKARIRERVADPDIAEKLIPDYFITTRRLCIDTNYYETFNRPNVTLVDLRHEPLERLTETGFETSQGTYEIDTLILATGFDAITGALSRLDITGRDGQKLANKWKTTPASYLGVTVAGFPNMFVATGPSSPAALSNVVVSIETHVEWIADMLTYLRDHKNQSFEATAQAEQEWVDHANAVTDQTLMRFSEAWYTGLNVAGKARFQMVYLGGVGPYEATLKEVAHENYRGFALA